MNEILLKTIEDGEQIINIIKDKIKRQTGKLKKILENEGKDIMLNRGEYINETNVIYSNYKVCLVEYDCANRYDIKVTISFGKESKTDFYLNDNVQITIINAIEKL